ncbi:Vps62-related protein [Pseudomonas sp. NPDC098747]|uniref:Vps62-related protein n=1 Tax=Pseudomonas sp. NPDC098747 TaxID=3364487 RepID=UPI00383ACA75
MTTQDNTAPSDRQREPIRVDNLLIEFTTEYRSIWDTYGSNSVQASFWRPTPAPDVLPGYFPLGDVAVLGLKSIDDKKVVAVVCEATTRSADPGKGKALAAPVDYELIWNDLGSGATKSGSIWRPIPPEGYVALGSVCSSNYEKPSRNAVRCVRADLVRVSAECDLIWNDKGSGAKQSVSTWSAVPPTAAAGEIHMAPGTFIGFGGHSLPADFPVYSLRMDFPLQINPKPPAPVLLGETPTPLNEPDQPTYIARLPWFAVKDPLFTPLEQRNHSSFYQLERTDYYILIGHGHNTGQESTTFRWSAQRAQGTRGQWAFSKLTSVDFGVQWNSQQTAPIMFSARLSPELAQCEIPASEWLDTSPIDVVAVVESNKAVAVYLIQSDYRLVRSDGTSVVYTHFTDGRSLHISQYAPVAPAAIVAQAAEPEEAAVVEIPAVNNENADAPEVNVSSATDTAP